jgi:hypothetical protein
MELKMNIFANRTEHYSLRDKKDCCDITILAVYSIIKKEINNKSIFVVTLTSSLFSQIYEKQFRKIKEQKPKVVIIKRINYYN